MSLPVPALTLMNMLGQIIRIAPRSDAATPRWPPPAPKVHGNGARQLIVSPARLQARGLFPD
jgi:hypothetical protein